MLVCVAHFFGLISRRDARVFSRPSTISLVCIRIRVTPATRFIASFNPSIFIMKSIFACTLGTILVLLALSGRSAAQSCSMANVIMCPLYSYTIHNNTYCAHDASRPWCTPPQTPYAKSRCTALPPGQIAQIRPGCPKLGVRFLPNGLGNQYTFCQDATDGAIYTRLNVMYDMFYYCATSPDATTPVLPSPQPMGARRDATVQSLSEYDQYMLDMNQNNE